MPPQRLQRSDGNGAQEAPHDDKYSTNGHIDRMGT